MGKQLSLACLTSDLLGGRSFSVNYHLLLMIRGILDSFEIECIDVYNCRINDETEHSFSEIQKDYNVFLPEEKVRVLRADPVRYLETSSKLASYEVVFSELHIWSDALVNAKRLNPDLKIVSWVHSLVMQEFIANKHRKWIGFDNLLQMQKETFAISDHLIFVSKYEEENAKRFHGAIIRRSTFAYPIPEVVKQVEGAYAAKINNLDDINLLFSGRWEYRKGIEQLIDCFFQCHAESNMKLHILSDYHRVDNYERIFHSPVIREKFFCLRDKGAIRMVPWKRSRTEYLEYIFENCSIAVVPSLYDPFNIIAYDCIAMGIPIVLSGLCGIEELIPQDSETVIKVNPYDSEDIYNGIMTLSTGLKQKDSLQKTKMGYKYSDTISKFNSIIEGLMQGD